MTSVIAFYKGKGTFFDWLIRKTTRSAYSHCEFVPNYDSGRETQLCISSSPRDGGVRIKNINMADGKWDIVIGDWLSVDPLPFLELQLGKKYDWKWILFSHIFAFHRDNPNRWGCTELIATALELSNPRQQTPQSLYDLVKLLNFVWNGK